MRRLRLAGSAVALTALMSLGVSDAAASTLLPPEPGHDQVLYNFGGANGAGPLSGVMIGSDGVLYGTTVFGGQHDDGDVYKLTPEGSGYTETILHTFGAPGDGAKPGGNVTADAHGDLFGVTVIGGADQDGTAYELVPKKSGYSEVVIHTFTGGTDGAQPLGALVIDRAGNLYGVTQFGGSAGGGVVFELQPKGTGYRERVLHAFRFGAALPQAGLAMAADGSLYGTGYGAGSMHENGLVFRLGPEKKGFDYTDLYNFKGGQDGSNPDATLTLDNRTGAIYGVAEYGGGAGGDGAVFELTPKGTGYSEVVLHGFGGGRQGALLQAPVLLEANGDLFGTTAIGGAGCSGTGCGTAFELVRSGSKYAYKFVYRFRGPPDGAEPQWAPLVAEPNGDLIGTTRSGGTFNTCSDGGPGGATGCGTLFELIP